MTTEKQPSLAETYAGEALGTPEHPFPWPAGASPHLIGRNLIVACNAHRGWYKRPEVSYESLLQAPGHRGDGLSIGWRRLPTEAEQQYPGAHAFDRSSDYLAAARDASLPWGPPEWVSGAPYYGVEPAATRRAGLWYVDVDYADSPWNGYDLPAVCQDGQVWLWTPSLRAAIACGYLIGPVLGGGAILWSEQHPLLRTWAERVWAARRALEENDSGPEHERWPIPQARLEAIALVKRVYVQTIGKFGDLETSKRLSDEEYDRRAPAWYRPEWFAMIHAEALAYSFAVMRRAVARGYPPLWARIDTLGFASGGYTDSIELAHSGIGLHMRPGALGAWHYDCSVPMSELADPEPHTVRVEGRSAGLKLPAVRMRGVTP